MESRRVIHYRGNSIKPRKVSMPSIYKRMRQEGMGVAADTNYIIPIIDKVYATENCMWCPHDFKQFEVVCPQCHNCQYCGMVANSNTFCNMCGNHLPDELKEQAKTHKQNIRVF